MADQTTDPIKSLAGDKKVRIFLMGKYDTREVIMNGKLLDPGPSQKIRNHSPDGFAWGYGGSGPAQLALAICLEFLPEDVAEKVYQDFKFKFIGGLPQSNFVGTWDVDFENMKIELVTGNFNFS